ncbi:MAG: Holliday junction branch migration protein RuvA [Clostridia bacterium]|nr:Holliday junction branch migration protein RuvA [Clostridia bacterium]
MFYYLDGTVAHVEPYLAVIDCGGVGYACKTTNATLGQLQKGKRGRLYTYLNVGEGVFDLYGFATQGELGSFKQLLAVSGVGPKAALAILSSVSPEGLAMAVITGDEKTLTRAPGVGKKIAQRIILELKDKLAKEQQSDGFIPAAAAVAAGGGKAVEAAQALAVLGYSQADISAAMKGLDVDALPLEELVRQALKRMVK